MKQTDIWRNDNSHGLTLCAVTWVWWLIILGGKYATWVYWVTSIATVLLWLMFIGAFILQILITVRKRGNVDGP